MKELICISCPLGCRMTVEKKGEEWLVQGNTCPRGKQYAIDEMTAPKRMVTSSLAVTNGNEKMVSVKTNAPLPKELIFKALDLLKGVTVTAPIEIGNSAYKGYLRNGNRLRCNEKSREKIK